MTTPSGVPDRRSGTYLLVVGGSVIAVCIVVLALLAPGSPDVAVPALVLDALLLAAMVVLRLEVRPIRPRQWSMTLCLLVAGVLSLGAVVLIESIPS